jgi:hypothetical protein
VGLNVVVVAAAPVTEGGAAWLAVIGMGGGSSKLASEL